MEEVVRTVRWKSWLPGCCRFPVFAPSWPRGCDTEVNYRHEVVCTVALRHGFHGSDRGGGVVAVVVFFGSHFFFNLCRHTVACTTTNGVSSRDRRSNRLHCRHRWCILRLPHCHCPWEGGVLRGRRGHRMGVGSGVGIGRQCRKEKGRHPRIGADHHPSPLRSLVFLPVFPPEPSTAIPLAALLPLLCRGEGQLACP